MNNHYTQNFLVYILFFLTSLSLGLVALTVSSIATHSIRSMQIDALSSYIAEASSSRNGPPAFNQKQALLAYPIFLLQCVYLLKGQPA